MARIILIDDEVRLLQTLARFLELQGHEVVCGSGFESVAQHLWPGRFEMLITDIVMPDFDGMQVLSEVVEDRGCQEPVILITGEPNLETAAAAVRQGAFDYISKPVTKDKLLEAVHRGLRHVQLLRERDHAQLVELGVLRNLARLGESASVLTHEIRTPITSLRQALRAVGEKLGIEDRVLVEELLGNLNRIERMLGLTLSFAKPVELRLEGVAVAELFLACIKELRSAAVVTDMAIDVICPSTLQVRVDPQLFGEVISNLVRNAAEACAGKGRIEVVAAEERGGLSLDVRDDGPGVPYARRDEIWKPFHSSKDCGTGIGLAFCRKVVEAHGGTIRLLEAAGPGACFRIEIPAVVGADPAPRAD